MPKTGKPRGRPTVLTDDVIDAYLKAISKGLSDTDSAAVAGISRHTVTYWKARIEVANPNHNPETGELEYADDESNPPIPVLFDFFTRVEKAKAEGKMVRLGHIEAAMSTRWTAAAWWLERKYPDEFGRRDRRDSVVSLEEAEEVLDEHISMLEKELGVHGDVDD